MKHSRPNLVAFGCSECATKIDIPTGTLRSEELNYLVSQGWSVEQTGPATHRVRCPAHTKVPA